MPTLSKSDIQLILDYGELLTYSAKLNFLYEVRDLAKSDIQDIGVERLVSRIRDICNNEHESDYLREMEALTISYIQVVGS